MKFMFDTNIFNHILDNKTEINSFNKNHSYYCTHVQYDELKATPNEKRKKELLEIFKEIPQ